MWVRYFALKLLLNAETDLDPCCVVQRDHCLVSLLLEEFFQISFENEMLVIKKVTLWLLESILTFLSIFPSLLLPLFIHLSQSGCRISSRSCL